MSDYLHSLITMAKHCDPKVRPMPESHMTGKSSREIIHALFQHYGREHMRKAESLLRKNYPQFCSGSGNHLVREGHSTSGAREPDAVPRERESERDHQPVAGMGEAA